MLIPFRQGIVKIPQDTTNAQVFLSLSSGNVSLDTTNGKTIVAFAHRGTNYLHTEHHPTPNAWTGPFTAGSDYWLYWDIDTRTAVRTFGHTTLEPIASTQKPQQVSVGQMWFDLNTNQMYEYNGTGWFEVIRVIACKLAGATSIRAWNGSYNFMGSQVGLAGYQQVGSIIYDETDSPLQRSNRTFFTTTDKLTTGIDVVSSIRVDSMTFQATAKQSMAPYTVVKLSEFGVIEPAGASSIRNAAFGVILDNVTAGEVTDVITSGVISNADWKWPYVNTLVYYSTTGELTTQSRPGIDPIGYVVEPTKILLQNTATGTGGGRTHQMAQGYSGSGTIQINTSLAWHIIHQTGPIVLDFNQPVGNSVVTFKLEIVGNGQDPIFWPDDGGIITIPNGQTSLIEMTYRPGIDGYSARWLRSTVDYL